MQTKMEAGSCAEMKCRYGGGMIQVIHPRGKEEIEREVQQIRAFTKKITRSKKAAFDYLVRAGFITKSGKPTKHYR